MENIDYMTFHFTEVTIEEWITMMEQNKLKEMTSEELGEVSG